MIDNYLYIMLLALILMSLLHQRLWSPGFRSRTFSTISPQVPGPSSWPFLFCKHQFLDYRSTCHGLTLFLWSRRCPFFAFGSLDPIHPVIQRRWGLAPQNAGSPAEAAAWSEAHLATLLQPCVSLRSFSRPRYSLLFQFILFCPAA